MRKGHAFVPELQRASALSRVATGHAIPECLLRAVDAVTIVRVQALRARHQQPVTDAPELPVIPNSARGSDPVALWRGPDDWLVYSLSHPAGPLLDWIDALPTDTPLVVTDVSSASVLLELRGPAAVPILMRDCTLDLEGNAVPPGGCAHTAFAQTSVTIHRPHEPDTWRLLVERSVALDVWDWLVDTMG
jgi:heterotetrameric sarcosine oxidase gamma subunit